MTQSLSETVLSCKGGNFSQCISFNGVTFKFSFLLKFKSKSRRSLLGERRLCKVFFVSCVFLYIFNFLLPFHKNYCRHCLSYCFVGLERQLNTFIDSQVYFLGTFCKIYVSSKVDGTEIDCACVMTPNEIEISS